MRWFLEVAFIGIAASWRWLVGSVVIVGALVGILFGVGVLGGGGEADVTPLPVVASPTPTPVAAPTPAATRLATPVPALAPVLEPTMVPTVPAAKFITVPILATGAINVGSLEFVLVYDPAKLELAQVERGVLAGNALIDYSSPGPGRLWTGIIDVQGMNGSGSMAMVKFKLRGDVGGTMPLTLENIAAFDATTLVDIVTGTTPGEFKSSGLSPLSPILLFQ